MGGGLGVDHGEVRLQGYSVRQDDLGVAEICCFSNRHKNKGQKILSPPKRLSTNRIQINIVIFPIQSCNIEMSFKRHNYLFNFHGTIRS